MTDQQAFKRAENFMNASIIEGAYGAVATGAAAGAAGIILNRYSPRFAAVGWRMKMWLMTGVVTAGFYLRAEQHTFRDPTSRYHGYGKATHPSATGLAVEEMKAKARELHEKEANMWQRTIRPFLIKERLKIGMGVWATAMGGSLIYFSRLPVPFSQKLIQARVVAQGAVLLPLIFTAALASLEDDRKATEKENEKKGS